MVCVSVDSSVESAMTILLPFQFKKECSLSCSFRFFGELLKKIEKINTITSEANVPVKMDFIRLKTYEDDQSTGDVKVVGGDKLARLRGKHVLVVEDIVDTGNDLCSNQYSLFCHLPNEFWIDL